MARGAWALPLPLLLVVSGCALPPAVTIASYALDGISFIASGKSLTDHAISVALNKDCALFRVVRGMDVCVEPVEDDEHRVMVAVLPSDESWGAGVTLAVTGDPMVLPPDLAALAADLGAAATALEPPPLALLQTPELAASEDPWADAIIDALAAMPHDPNGWTRPGGGAGDSASLANAPAASEPARRPQLAARRDDGWLWSVDRPVRLWPDAVGAEAAPVPEATMVAARTATAPVRTIPRPQAKPATIAALASRGIETAPPVMAGDPGPPEEAVRPAAVVTAVADVPPVVMSPHRDPRALTPSVVYKRELLATLAECDVDRHASPCVIADTDAPRDRMPASSRPVADSRIRRTAVLRRPRQGVRAGSERLCETKDGAVSILG